MAAVGCHNLITKKYWNKNEKHLTCAKFKVWMTIVESG